MGFLEKLKTIGIDFPSLKSVISINITNKIDHSIKIDGSTLLLNPGKLNRKQKLGLKEIIRTAALDESGAILNQDCTPIVDEALKALPDIEATAKRFLTIIPPSDIPLLHACLFLRMQHKVGGNVSNLKEQISRTYGQRGRNLANLCSAGYLEDWFWPLYETLLRSNPDDPEAARAIFRTIYNGIVIDLPWTEFVSTGTSANKSTSHIVEKMKHNIQNGVRFINIHGIGDANVKKINAILPEIQKQTGSIVSHISSEPGRIFVRLEAKPKLLTPD